ncbi:aminotransferase class I/II-fold pyridoxal phosphate-dependent enzyme [Candidatus Ruminimicrobiellum ovillum]|uniref:aminotransferase class I/II-fold pyridoxal phosphate-dependent enzyme n=1 Tax=Candidatus Ruminimicrobiellum ovillum TaxID=1947927 RepID=UPI00355971FD
MNFYEQELTKLKQDDCLRKISDISYKKDKYIVVNDKKYINLSSNDYLGLSTNKTIIQDFVEANKQDNEFLFSSASARLLTGTSSIYSKLEKNLANLFNKESCLLYNTGYQCNLGTISSLVQKGDVVFCDKLNHASIIAGMKLSQTDFYRYKHLDYQHLETLLRKYRTKYKKALIVSESVFSMDGDIADIKKLVELKNKYDCILMIDEAHAFGVFGNNLCGICETQNCLQNVDIITATLGKAFASVGAFCVANKTYIDYFINKSGSFIFSTALAPVNVMWTNWLIENKINLIKEKQQKLNTLFKQVHEYIKDNGQTQIIPVIIGQNDKTIKTATYLQEKGYFVLPVRVPTVPPNTARLRLSLTADITFEEMKTFFEIIKEQL